jgi:hypothetical protein
MVIRKPSLSVDEARRLAEIRATAKALPENKEFLGLDRPSVDAAETGPDQELLQTNTKRLVIGGLSFTPDELASSDESQTGKSKSASLQTMRSTSSNNTHVTGARAGQSDNVQVFVSALYPAAGVSPTFELVCHHYPPHKALQMILRRALHDYDTFLEDGRFQQLSTTYDVDEATFSPPFVQTSRMMSRSTLRVARAHFDPLGLETARAFGRSLATAALAAFFSNEPKQVMPLRLK